MVFVLRLLPKHSHFRNPDRRIVDSSELSLAESKLLSMTQLESFYFEIKNSRYGKHLHTKSYIRAYSPFISSSGLMRSNGRVKSLSEITYDVNHPIILDGLPNAGPLATPTPASITLPPCLRCGLYAGSNPTTQCRS